MSRFTDRQHLKGEQYSDGANLSARIALHKRFSTNPYGLLRWLFPKKIGSNLFPIRSFDGAR